MKRTHTEQVEYFEHGGDRYRRFADGSWQVKVSNGWSERFCDAKQLEAIYQQPQRCKSCKFYDENPHLHCAVHPMGPEGVCGDWDEMPIKEPIKGEKRIGEGAQRVLVHSPSVFRNIGSTSTRRRYSVDGCEGIDVAEVSSYPLLQGDEWRVRVVGTPIEEMIEFALGEAHGEPTTVTMPIDAPGLTRIGSSTFQLRMDEMIAYGMNELWGIHSVAGDIAVIFGGKVERIVVGSTESAPGYTLWEHPDVIHEREVREGVEQHYRQITNQYFARGFRCGSFWRH